MTPRTVSLKARGFNFESFMWIFTRLSALAMYVCALVGMVGALILGARTEMNLADLIRWTFMPSPTHVQNTAIADLAPWTTLFWKIMGTIFIFFATSHGLHGLLAVLEDYIAKRGVQIVMRVLFLILTVGMIAVTTYLLWTA